MTLRQAQDGREPDDLVRGVEAALFAAEQPLTVEELSNHLGGADVRTMLHQLGG